MHRSIPLTRILLLSGIFLIALGNALAQQLPKFEWVKHTARGAGYEYAFDVTVDASGNVLSTGSISDVTDFDPATSTFEITPSGIYDIYISKLDGNGNFLWAKTVGGTGQDEGQGIVTDAAGNVYVTGFYINTVDFDPGPSVFNLNSSGTDLFILKLDPNGNFVWAKHYDPAYGNSIAYDPSGFIYVTASASFGSLCRVIKLDTDGNEIWTKALTASSGGNAVSVGASGNVVVTGWLSATSDFDPGPGVFNLTPNSTDLFIWKLNGSGDLIWAKLLDVGAPDLYRSGSSLDGSENVYLADSFSGTIDFDPGPGTFTLSTGGSSRFVSKLDAEGNFSWARKIDVGEANFISTDAAGNSYVTGSFSGTVDFNPDVGTFNQTSAGNQDTYILKLDASGNFVWATRTGSLSSDEGSALHADANGNIFLTSFFYQTSDFDPTCTTSNLTSRANTDTYIQKLSSITSHVITSFSPANGTSGTTVTINGSGFSTTPSNNIVRFYNGVTATVTASTATSITVTAPFGIATGKIAVTVGCTTVQSAADFVLPTCIEKVFDFTGTASGNEPWGSLISDGTFLYGMTNRGGANNLGAVFKIRTDGTDYINLLDFTGSTNGANPLGSLIYDGSFLYGMTALGGVNNMGIIFKMKPDGTGFVKLLDFDGATNGRQPNGSLLLDNNFLYGMTSIGGANSFGTIFKIMTDGTGYVKLQDFDGTAKGSFPLGSLITDGTFLYGMASGGGTSGFGTLFKIQKDGTGFLKLRNFTGTLNGRAPYGDLVSDGTFLYGMTSRGGTVNDGVIFKIGTDGNGFTKLLDFNINANGDSPFGSLTYDGTYLYGLTYNGLVSSFGTLFRINTDGSAHSILCNFATFTDGALPAGSLLLDGGFLYGMTQFGGTNDMGVIFKYAIGSAPSITSFAPASGPVGTTITITGTNFSSTPSSNIVRFNGIDAVVTSSTPTSITTTVPVGAVTGPITVSIGSAAATSSTDFIVICFDPEITGLSPESGVEGDVVTITGTDFNPTASENEVDFNGVSAIVTASTATSLTTTVPVGAITGPITVTTGCGSNTTDFAFTINCSSTPGITSFTPTLGAAGASVAIDGINFSTTPADNHVYFNGVEATITASSSTSITATIPTGALTGKITVNNGCASAISTSDFVIECGPAPTISSFSPTSGIAGTSVTISGTNFSATPGNNLVYFNGVVAVVTGSTVSSIVAEVPAGTSPGPIEVIIGCNTTSSATDFDFTEIITITSQPSDVEICEGANATFQVSATGSATLYYQWVYSPDGIVAFENFSDGNGASGSSTSTLLINPQDELADGYFRCVVSGGLATEVESDIAHLSVAPKPTAPTAISSSRCGGGTLTLNATGSVDGQYKWYTVATAGTAIAGEVKSSYTTASLSASTQFFVSSVNGNCESERTQVTATITPLPSSPTVTGASACPGSILTLNASGGSNGQYKWYSDASTGTPLPGEVNNSYTTPPLMQTTAYFVTINANGCESSRTPVIATIITSGCAPEIENASLSTGVEGTIVIDLKPLITTVGTLDVTSIKVTSGPQSGAITSIENGILTITYSGVNFGGSESITIEACNTNGLCGQQDFTIEVDGDVVIYNGISPNDDGKNEIFILQFIDALPSTKTNKVFIYNRWGDEVFSISDYDNKTRVFSGRNKEGNKLPSGTYYYKIHFPLQDKTVTGYLSVKY